MNIFISLFLFLFLFMIVSLSSSLREGYTPSVVPTSVDPSSPKYSHSVDLPGFGKYTCTNFCGPQAQCATTREQCTSDVDCYGCQPTYVKPKVTGHDVTGLNDAGKLTFNQAPQYSTLTSDIGTRAAAIISKDARIPQMDLGYDRWTKSFNQGMELFKKKEKENNKYMQLNTTNAPKWPTTEGILGTFQITGPRAANAYF